jgi:DNA-binding MarR family transcriptional regulator
MDPLLTFAIGGAAGGVAAWTVRLVLERRDRTRYLRGPDPTLPPFSASPVRWRGEPAGGEASFFVDGPTAAGTVDPYRPDGPPQEPLRISGRVVQHLFLQGRLGPDEVGSPASTQRGICAALEADQGAVSRVLGRLEAAGVVEVARRHVRGANRRLNVYTLTRRGELVAHELRRSELPPRPYFIDRAFEPTATMVAPRAATVAGLRPKC